MSSLRASWQNTPWKRPLVLALLVTWGCLTLSAAFPQNADAIGPLIPILIGGGALVGLFGDKVAGAAGDLVRTRPPTDDVHSLDEP